MLSEKKPGRSCRKRRAVLSTNATLAKSSLPLLAKKSGGLSHHYGQDDRTDVRVSRLTKSISCSLSRKGFTSFRALFQSRSATFFATCFRQFRAVSFGPLQPVCRRAAFRNLRFGEGHVRSARYQTRSNRSRPFVQGRERTA